MNKLYPVFFLLFFSLPIFVSGQSDEPNRLVLTLEKAWMMMEKNNFEIKKLKLVRAGLLREVKSIEQLIPGVSTGVGLFRNSAMISELTGSPSGDRESDLWSVRGAIDLRLSLKTGIATEEKIQLIQLQLKDLEIAAKIKTEKAELQKLFYEILSGVKNTQLLEEYWILSNERLTMVESQYNQGLRSELDLLSARITAAKDLPPLEKSKADQQKRWIVFREAINVPDSIMITLISTEFEEQYQIPHISLLSQGLKENEKMQTSELEVIFSGLDHKLSRNDLLDPELGISLGWSSLINPVFNSQSWSSDEWEDKLNLSFSLSLPLDSRIKGSSGQLELKSREDSIQKAEWNKEETARQLEGQLKSLLLDIKLSMANLELDQLNITLQEQNYEKMRENFENGRVSVLDLDDSRQELQSSLLTYETENLNLKFLAIELELLTGVTWGSP